MPPCGTGLKKQKKRERGNWCGSDGIRTRNILFIGQMINQLIFACEFRSFARLPWGWKESNLQRACAQRVCFGCLVPRTEC